MSARNLRSRSSMLSSLALATAGACLAASVGAAEYSERIVLGERDTQAAARELALTKIRDKAVEEAGAFVYLSRSHRANDDRFTDQVRLVSSGLVTVRVLREGFDLNPSGVLSYKVTADAVVDQSELDRRIRRFENDSKVAEELSRLAEANRKLAAELRATTHAGGAKDGLEAARRRVRSLELIQEVERLRATAANVLAPGALFAAAGVSERASNSRQERFLTQYRETWAALSNELAATIRSVQPQGDDLTISIEVRPSTTTVPRIRDLMNRPYRIWDQNAEVYASHFRPPENAAADEQYVETLMDVADVIDRTPVVLEVEVGSCRRSIPYFGVLNYHQIQTLEPSRLNPETFRKSLRATGETAQILGFNQRFHQPFVSRKGGAFHVTCSIAKAEAATVNSVRAQLVLSDRAEARTVAYRREH